LEILENGGEEEKQKEEERKKVGPALKALMDARVEFKERFVASGKGENGILQ
jgi:hypothetical protein